MFERLFRSWNEKAGTDMALSSDTALLEAAVQGNADALASLYRRHGALIYRFSLRMCQDSSIAEEVTQEVFLALIRQCDRFDSSQAALSTWLCGIARRQVWKHLERLHRSRPGDLLELDGEDERYEVESPDDDPAVLLTRKEAVARVHRGIDELPAQWREVIVLCELEEMSYEEAAQVMAVPIGTIRSRLHRARSRLKSLLLNEPVSGGKERVR